MVFTFKEQTVSGATIFSSTTAAVNNQLPAIMVHKDSFRKNKFPRWVVNRKLFAEGNFVNRAGSDDDQMNLVILLYGPDRDANLLLVQQLTEDYFYMDASDIDSNLSGQYYVVNYGPEIRRELLQTIRVTMRIAAYNNGV